MSREHADRENEITQVSLTDFPGIRIGQAENRQGGTGITVLLSEDPKGMAAGLHIGGGGPASRETCRQGIPTYAPTRLWGTKPASFRKKREAIIRMDATAPAAAPPSANMPARAMP